MDLKGVKNQYFDLKSVKTEGTTFKGKPASKFNQNHRVDSWGCASESLYFFEWIRKTCIYAFGYFVGAQCNLQMHAFLTRRHVISRVFDAKECLITALTTLTTPAHEEIMKNPEIRLEAWISKKRAKRWWVAAKICDYSRQRVTAAPDLRFSVRKHTSMSNFHVLAHVNCIVF